MEGTRVTQPRPIKTLGLAQTSVASTLALTAPLSPPGDAHACHAVGTLTPNLTLSFDPNQVMRTTLLPFLLSGTALALFLIHNFVMNLPRTSHVLPDGVRHYLNVFACGCGYILCSFCNIAFNKLVLLAIPLPAFVGCVQVRPIRGARPLPSPTPSPSPSAVTNTLDNALTLTLSSSPVWLDLRHADGHQRRLLRPLPLSHQAPDLCMPRRVRRRHPALQQRGT